MNTKNTKSAIIILLMIANIFFIYNIIILNVRTQNIPSEMIENAVNILKNGGFSLDKSAVQAKKPTNYIYEGVYSENIFKDIVKSFSGVPEDEIKPFNMRDTITYNEGDYIFTFSASDYMKISIMDKHNEKAKELYDDIAQAAEDQTDILIKSGISEVAKSDINKAAKIIRNFINKYPQQNIKSDFDIIGLKKDDANGLDKIVINRKVDGLPVDSHIVYIEIKDGEVVYFYGRWYFGAFVAKYKWPLLDSVNILFKCAEKDGSIINGDNLEKMDLEYNVLQHDIEKFYLRPSWRLTFESGKTLSYNMITGDKID